MKARLTHVAPLLLCCALLSGCSTSTYTILKRAQQGDPQAQYEYGRRLLTGQHTKPDPVFAYQWFAVAAGQGHPKAQAALGACYQRGLGTPRNEKLAFKWYNEAAVQNEEHALQAVLEQADKQKSNAAARRTLQTLLNAEHPMAELYLATRLLMNEACTESDRQQAVDLLRYAAMSGSGEAAFLLFMCYTEGSGVYPSPRLALGWLVIAAELEYEPALQLIHELQDIAKAQCGTFALD